MVKPIAWISHLTLFRRTRPLQSAWGIIWWWEARRIPYNFIVGTAGLISSILMLGTALVTEPIIGEAVGLPDSPLFGVMAVIAYGVMANVCFTGGWIVELICRRVWGKKADSFGEISFTIGTIFSVLLTLLPAALIVADGAYRVLVHSTH